MVASKNKDEFKNGRWEWNEETNSVVFISLEVASVVDPLLIPSDPNHRSAKQGSIAHHALTYRDTINEVELVAFERAAKRRAHYRQSPVITLADIKDVALFFVVEPLPDVFLQFFQTPKADLWLRGVIVYMHFFIQTCEQLMETIHLLRGPPPVDRPPRFIEMSRHLAEFRFILARQHACMVMSTLGSGGGHATRRHSNDVLLFELLIQLATRIAWIALQRRYLSVIDKELNRIFRTDAFSMKFTKRVHDEVSHSFVNRKTRDILYGSIEGVDCFGNSTGPTTEKQRIMLQNTPLLHDFQDSVDSQLLQVGMPNFETENERLNFVAKCFYDSEEELAAQNIEIGILGQNRSEFDVSLHPIINEKKEDTKSRELGDVHLSEKEVLSETSSKSSLHSSSSVLQEEVPVEIVDEEALSS